MDLAIRDISMGPGTRLNMETIVHERITWVNIEKPTQKEMGYLAQHYPFHPLDLEDCLSRIQRPKLDEYEDYLFLVLLFPVFNPSARITIPSQVGIFIGEDYVVTAHSGNIGPLVELFRSCQEDEGVRQESMGRSSGHLLYKILDRLAKYCFPILNKIISNVEAIEDQLLEGERMEIIQELSIIRRDIIAFRRIIRPQTDVLAALEQKERAFLREELEVYFGDISDQIGQIWDALEDYKEVVEGLNDTYNWLAANRINEAMRTLTIVSTVLLPMVVVSGLYGMNVPLPFQDTSYAFLALVFLNLFIVVSMLFFFRSRRWI